MFHLVEPRERHTFGRIGGKLFPVTSIPVATLLGMDQSRRSAPPIRRGIWIVWEGERHQLSNTTNHNSNSELRQGFQEQPGNSTSAVSLPEALILPKPQPQQVTTTPTMITLWCFLDQSSTYNFFHFPHALQFLSQCWSFFQSKQQEIIQSKNNTNSTAASPPLEFQCRVNLDHLAGFGSIDQDWRAALVVNLMQCTYSYGAFDYSVIASRNQVLPWSLPFTNHDDAPRMNETAVPRNLKRKTRRPLPANNASHVHYFCRPERHHVFQYFSHPSHVLELQNRLQQKLLHQQLNDSTTTTRVEIQSPINSKNDDNYRSNGTLASISQSPVTTANNDNTGDATPNTLRIGLVDRLSKRRLGNNDLLEQAIAKAYPHAIVERGIMERLSPLQQFA